MELKELLDRVDAYQADIQRRRPLAPEEVRQLDAYYKIGTTYSSNALEGNSLTLIETKVLIEDGLTAGGKPIRDCYEVTGHAKAYDYMLKVARGGELTITESLIRELHHLFYCGIDEKNAGRYRDVEVIITGTDYIPPVPQEIPALMQDFVVKLEMLKSEIHPVELAAYAHRRLVDIHPFIDGNGRTARLLMNLVLINKGYCIVSIPPILRHDYLAALQRAQKETNPSDEDFVRLIAECEIESQRDYCRMFHIEKPKDMER